MTMRLFDNIGESAIALVVAVAAAIIAAIALFVGVIFVGTTFFKGESSYGVGLAFGPALAVIGAVLTFVFVFRKIRSI